MSLDDFPIFARSALADAAPMSQNTAPDDIGFGWLYYGLARNLRPKYMGAIGSARGFMPLCLGRAAKDTGFGHVVFIDPSYSGTVHPGWGGQNWWSDAGSVARWFARFGLAGWISHLKMTSDEAWPVVQREIGSGTIGIVV